MARYRYATCLTWGGDVQTGEHEVEVEFSVAWGSPETGRFGPPENYDPGSGDVIEDIRVMTIDGKARPWGLAWGHITDAEAETMMVEKLDAHEEDMLATAREAEAARDDDNADRLYRARRDERLTGGDA